MLNIKNYFSFMVSYSVCRYILSIVAHMPQTLRERDRRGNTIGRLVLDVLYQLSCSDYPDILVLAVLLCLFRAAYPVLALSFCLSFLRPSFFFGRPFFGRPVPAAPSLSSLLKLHRRYLVPRLLTQDGE
jgi:hypothetical protein